MSSFTNVSTTKDLTTEATEITENTFENLCELSVLRGGSFLPTV